VRFGDVDHYYTRTLNWAAVIRDAKVEARMIPPHQGFVWPLEVGKRWTYQGVWKIRIRSSTSTTACVVAVETVEVLAGRFEALKIVERARRRVPTSTGSPRGAVLCTLGGSPRRSSVRGAARRIRGRRRVSFPNELSRAELE